VLTLPEKTPPRTDYFWTRQEAAKRIRAARSRPETRHLARLILVGLYTGTRPGAILRLRWLPSTDAGWFDLGTGVLHRRGSQTRSSKKKQPPARIHERLLPHLRCWRKTDEARGIVHVIHYDGQPVKRVKRSWETVRRMAGAERRDSPHVLRHSSATMFMSWGLDVAEIAGFLGMSVQTLLDVYGHHHPAFQENIARSSPKKSPRIGVNRTGTK